MIRALAVLVAMTAPAAAELDLAAMDATAGVIATVAGPESDDPASPGVVTFGELMLRLSPAPGRW